MIKGRETNSATGMVDARDRDVDSMSIESMLDAHKKYHGSFNDRVSEIQEEKASYSRLRKIFWIKMQAPEISGYQDACFVLFYCA